LISRGAASPDKVLRLLPPFLFPSSYEFLEDHLTIQDGINEYADSITCRFAGERLDATTAANKIADAWNLTDPDESEAREQFITALSGEGRAFFPYDDREICALDWEQLDPIRITISDGLIESITGIPEG
jgi:hypothetical protein